MSNLFGIPVEVELRLRARDALCVYCKKEMTIPQLGGDRRKWATIEHFREQGPFYWNKGLKEEDLAICCFSCNSSRGGKTISNWFEGKYCKN